MTLEGLYQDLARFGVDIEKLKQCNPTELQLIDLVGGLEVAFRAKGEFSQLVGRSLPVGELVTQ